jgi:hypothetical protein
MLVSYMMIHDGILPSGQHEYVKTIVEPEEGKFTKAVTQQVRYAIGYLILFDIVFHGTCI